MSIEANKAIVRRLYDEFWNAEKLELADTLFHPAYVFDEGYAAGAPSVEAIKEGNRFWHRVLPDIHFTIDDMIAEGEAVCSARPRSSRRPPALVRTRGGRPAT